MRDGSRSDPDTAIGGPHGQFPSTQISLLQAASSGGALPNEALERVAVLYWKPVYRFIRLKFHKNNEDAKDLTQSFFATALRRDLFGRFDPAQASFRTYLRMAVERFAATEYTAQNRQKRGGGIQFEPADEQVVEQAATAESPEAVFEREWQRQLFELALEDLRAHCTACGKQLQFEIFEAYDLADADRPSYAAIATRHGVAETSVTNYLAWARRMLRQFVVERLRGVIADDRDLRAEMRRLWL
jgi:RNA polymerase sigma factor (sigma-70 family)